MSRPLRIEYPGAWYHVMNRGASRADIFDTDDDRGMFLALLSDIRTRFAVETHGYCLMSNHYHLLLHTPEGRLARAMRHVNGLYTQYLNRNRRSDGPLFRGRYKSIVVEDDTYLLQVSRYIHLNPLGPGLVDDPAGYPWSSCLDYVHKPRTSASLNTAYLLDMIGGRNATIQRHRYRRFLDEGVDEPTSVFYAGQRRSPVLGSETFRDDLAARQDENVEIPGLRALRSKPSLAAIREFVHDYGREQDELPPLRRRDIGLYLAHRQGYRLREIATGFGMRHYASVSSAIRRLDIMQPTVDDFIQAYMTKTRE